MIVVVQLLILTTDILFPVDRQAGFVIHGIISQVKIIKGQNEKKLVTATAYTSTTLKKIYHGKHE